MWKFFFFKIFCKIINFLDLLFILIVYFYLYVKMSDCTRFQMAFGSHIEVLQWILIFADYWPITEFPAILKSEMQDTSFFLGHHSTWLAAARQEFGNHSECRKTHFQSMETPVCTT